MHPLSFRHMANASGISLNVAADYKINNKIKWQFFLKNKKWQTQEGVDETYFTNNTIAAYPLNKVSWHSALLGVTFVYLL